VVLAVMAWLAAPPKSLAEASQREAMRRQTAGKASKSLTNIGQPAEIPLVSTPTTPPAGEPQAGAAGAAGATAAAPSAEKVKDEKYWRDRIVAAQDKISRDTMMVTALQSRINVLKRDSVNTDDPMKQRKVKEELQLTIDELDRTQKGIEAGKKSIVDIQDEARRLGVPAGWVRTGT
jgi:hypothetical protein